MKDIKMVDDKTAQLHPVVVAFRAEPALTDWLDTAAAAEGISRADYARRALIRERQRQTKEGAA
jgi:hypothetical protein